MATHPLSSASTDDPPTFEVRNVGLAAPFSWLKAGIHTFAATPGYSLLYGALFALACLGTVVITRHLPWLTITFLTSLMLIGQYLAAGLYPAAEQHRQGQRISIRAALDQLRGRATNLAFFALFLGLVMAAWVRLSSLLFAFMFTTLSPPIDGFLGIFSGQADPVVLGFFFIIGFVLALTVFVCSAVAVPLIVDRDQNPVTAIVVSTRAVNRNWPAMVLWAALITAATLIGILTAFVAMLVIFPILGYATWHSYRALVT
ncbi:putative integral membrane protein [Thioflavicoccus mobilis 8321]|uniref:Putative integral membrane protein n=1 Tax=Thioflavicoccus mobilis 8321 TaxID=765912 RepID=L0GY26_9GAMM|nr:DUF2189 domain-containing protein [Thioflavicoccus mobilis]AGA90871.1 putative integral membrane protein [Thioflavicoccus mobilis 8321]